MRALVCVCACVYARVCVSVPFHYDTNIKKKILKMITLPPSRILIDSTLCTDHRNFLFNTFDSNLSVSFV